MKVLKTGKSAGGVDIQIEEWSENYSFMPYGSTLAFYPKSKATHKGQFAPKAGESYRFSFSFPVMKRQRQHLQSWKAATVHLLTI